MDDSPRNSTDKEASSVSLLPSSETIPLPQNLPRKNPYRPLLLPLTIAFLTGALTASILWSTAWPPQAEPTSSPPHQPILTCGTTPTSARSMGCQFQTWSYSWVPLPCWDAELNEEFIAIHKREQLPYYLDANGTSEVPFDDVYKGDIEVLYTGWGSHYWHCAFLMRKFFRHRAMLTVSSWDYEHVEHCQMWLANPFAYEWRRITTKANLMFSRCDLARGWDGVGARLEVVV